MADAFVTEFGHKIDFVPGYYEANCAFAEASLGVSYSDLKQRPKLTFEGDESDISAASLKDLVWFSKLALFMDHWGLWHKRSRALDLGGGRGATSAFLKASGLVAHATTQDLIDYSSVKGNYYDTFIADVKAALGSGAPKHAEAAQAIQGMKESFDLYPQHHLMTGIFQDFVGPARIDQRLHADIYEVEGTFDLITSAAFFDALDIDRALSKVHDLLADGGVFVCLDEYWWWAINSSALVGHFPYVMQRLSYSDLEKYIAAHHPAFLPGLKDRCDFLYAGTTPPTINDWQAIAAKKGLRTVAIERIMPLRHHRLRQCPPKLMYKPWFKSDEVLRDIRYRKPDVSFEDLLTSSFVIAMTKA